MKKTTQKNVRRSLRRVLTMLLALVMTLSLAVQAFAAIGNWPATGDTTVDRYMQNSGTFYNGDTVIAPKYSNFGGFINVYGVPKGSDASTYVMTPTSINFGTHLNSKTIPQIWRWARPTTSRSRFGIISPLKMDGHFRLRVRCGGNQQGNLD